MRLSEAYHRTNDPRVSRVSLIDIFDNRLNLLRYLLGIRINVLADLHQEGSTWSGVPHHDRVLNHLRRGSDVQLHRLSAHIIAIHMHQQIILPSM